MSCSIRDQSDLDSTKAKRRCISSRSLDTLSSSRLFWCILSRSRAKLMGWSILLAARECMWWWNCKKRGLELWYMQRRRKVWEVKSLVFLMRSFSNSRVALYCSCCIIRTYSERERERDGWLEHLWGLKHPNDKADTCYCALQRSVRILSSLSEVPPLSILTLKQPIDTVVK